jgi:hypothetical protein
MSPALLGFLWALMFGAPAGLFAGLRRHRAPAPAPQQHAQSARCPARLRNMPRVAAAVSERRTRVIVIRHLVALVILLFAVDSLAFYFGRPIITFGGLMPLILANLMIVGVIGTVADLVRRRISAGSAVPLLALVAFGVVYLVGHNSGHDSYRAAHLVSVTVEPGDQMPASSTSNMVIVSPDIATTKASQAMATGLAGQRNYSTYLQLEPATLQYVNGHMWYVFPLQFDGAGNKARLGAVEPGYIMVSAEDPNAVPVEHYDGAYSMIVSLGGGQGSEPDRWAYDHGYDTYLLDDPTLEINDQGLPFYTVTLLRPRLGWTFMAPVGVLMINAHTGQISQYDLNEVPDWVDRVYSEQMARTIANWYGQYAQAGFQGLGSSNANRFQVSGDPVMVYTGSGHPVWRMLLTSYNHDSSVSKIIELNAATGAMQIYTPQRSMGTENPVYQAFDNGSGIGASLIKANRYQAVDLTLHVIYGHLTWMVTYEPEGSNPSFVGIGFVDAYQATANNVVFGSSKSAALQNYLTQLAGETTANGNTPEQGGQYQVVTGTVAAIGWDITGGQKYWYVTLTGDRTHVYVGTAASVGPALVLAQPGDHVTIKILNVGLQESTRTMQSFADARVPLQQAGS